VTTPASPNQITLDDVQTEFGGTNPIEIAEYYAGGSYVPASVSGVPTSGQISLDNLRGKTKTVYAVSVSISPSSGVYPYTSTISWTSNMPVGGYVNIQITYPNGSTSTLTNQAINGSASATWTSSTGTGTGSIIAYGYNSSSTLLATSSSVSFTVYTPATIDQLYFYPDPVYTGTSQRLYYQVSNTSVVSYTITGPDGTYTGSRYIGGTSPFSSQSFAISWSGTGSVTGQLLAYGSNGGSVTQTVYSNVIAAPSYTLTPNVSAVNEGSSFNITFTTNQSGNFGYTISGVSSADLNYASLTGTVSNGTVLYFNVAADQLTEGTETFTISLDNSQASAQVNIYDTSITPIIPSFTSFGVTRPNAYPTADATITWTTSNASYVNIQVINSNGSSTYQYGYSANGSYVYPGSSSNPLGLYQVNLTAYSSTGNTASDTRYFTVIQEPIIPSFTSASLSTSSTVSTNNVTVNWATSNATSVDVQVTFPSGTVVTSNNQSANATGFVLFYGSSSNQIGQYTVVLTARSSTNNTTTTTLYFTYTAPATFSATFNSFYSTGATGTSSVAWSEANRNIVINGNGTFNLNASGYASYTTTATGYLYCFLYVGTEQFWDFGYFLLDGAIVQDTASISGVYKNGTGGYSGGPAYVLNNYKVGPISAGTHTIQIKYTNDYSYNPNGDVVSGAWTWSAT